jgi:peptidoglycan biosynthesis protein MviN/MurJ (putative lipid II flippase)
MAAGQMLLTLTIPIDQGFAARLGEGAVATLGYANRIVTLVTGLGTIVIGRALLPVLSSAVAQQNYAMGRRQATQWALLLFVAGVVIAVVGWLLAALAVRLLFERGAFTADASADVANVLRYGLLQLPFYFGGVVLVQWIAALGRLHILLAVACVALVVKVAMNLLLTQPLGLPGIMIGTALMYAVSLAGQYLLSRTGS